MNASLNKPYPDIISLLRQHLVWYPLIQVQDVYKLIFQGTMGPEHMVATRQEFSRRLEAEFETLAPDPGGRVFEPIRQDHLLFRLNLRPYKAVHENPDLLITPLLQTTRSFHGDMNALASTWAEFVHLVEAGEMTGFAMAEVRDLNRRIKKEDYPAIHHSEAYRQAYQPAYRLILERFVPKLELHAAI
jgi:hypothetical protein